VVCAASYEARPFAVHSAMPMATARRLCPEAVYLAPRMGHYAEISGHIRELFLGFAPQLEPLSLDEAFLDVQGFEGLFGPALEIGRQIQARIRNHDSSGRHQDRGTLERNNSRRIRDVPFEEGFSKHRQCADCPAFAAAGMARYPNRWSVRLGLPAALPLLRGPAL
jgi:impB/mucB/samB family